MDSLGSTKPTYIVGHLLLNKDDSKDSMLHELLGCCILLIVISLKVSASLQKNPQRCPHEKGRQMRLGSQQQSQLKIHVEVLVGQIPILAVMSQLVSVAYFLDLLMFSGTEDSKTQKYFFRCWEKWQQEAALQKQKMNLKYFLQLSEQ